MNAAELARPDSDSEADALSRCAAHPDHADDFLATRGKARTSRTIAFPTATLPDGRLLRDIAIVPMRPRLRHGAAIEFAQKGASVRTRLCVRNRRAAGAGIG